MQEKLLLLLKEVLVGVRRHRETPLLAGFDSFGMVRAALHSLATWSPKIELSDFPDGEAVTAALDLLVGRALEDELPQSRATCCLPSRECAKDPSATSRQQRPEEVLRQLAAWLGSFFEVFRNVHPKAIEVVTLRVEGCDNREVASQLELPYCLCKRILGDMRGVWELRQRGSEC